VNVDQRKHLKIHGGSQIPKIGVGKINFNYPTGITKLMVINIYCKI
jgi:hypothetical protein